ncbi:branched chain amino acid aminotransferase [Thermoclostridium stercorarium subsp. thermolacticum DSM 2910]|jgi:branched-chain amino acid aminotransferase|uniref:Branched-chain-amino-acid aminotransferase n=1 Tax=Thermoclostridium stercorarium subsp. thermolacticum DSM 2910 TaxID=1121336 RepID=A0A1B1YCY9_THEST|nr:branched-chain amino acid aminotransferase [Thermoclostridium stercorarium]ANW98624.1 branched chain amino acid aminotransferase [Thermoclostridium stercorarium subsp. thermolacticum DSM 2910]
MTISVERTKTPKQKPGTDQLVFGKVFSDHMFICDYSPDKGWHNARIVPYQNLSIDPSTMTLHYAQSIFEGLKAYKTKDGHVNLFRPRENIKRLNASCRRLCIPTVDEEFALTAIKKLVDVDRDWIPEGDGTSLYIRPFIFATEPHIGVRPSTTYSFVIITGPVGAYYKEGINPVKIYIEPNYVRAVRGGLGEIKASANYAASLKAQVEANEKGYTQVLWLDGVEKKYIEEVGTMNVFFIIGDEIVTPELSGSILPGITRKSCIELLRHWGYNMNERRISIQEVYEAHEKGLLKEVFGTGTAAVISPVGELCWNGNVITINNGKTGPISQRLYDTLTGIQYGKLPDEFGWIEKV